MNHKFKVQETEIKAYKCGGIAQLVERLPCTQEVSGSSPLTSTLTSPANSLEIESLTEIST